jgi:predicted  nucleic acid-binding Zn-ribbon protein
VSNDSKVDLSTVEKKLDGILGVLQAKKEESQKNGTSWSWVTAAIAALLAFIGLAFAAYDAWKKGREIAKLKHEKDVAEEAKQKAEIEVKLTAEAELQKARQLLISNIEKTIVGLEVQIAEAEKERQAIHAKIDQVTSWDDLDKLIK